MGCLAGRRSGNRASTCGTPTEPDDFGMLAPLCQSPWAVVEPVVVLAAVCIDTLPFFDTWLATHRALRIRAALQPAKLIGFRMYQS